MKNLKYLFFLLLHYYCYSQSNPNLILDQKNGFKDLKIGDSYSKWSDNILLTNIDDDLKWYDFKGDCCKKLFSTDLEKIRLGFTNNELEVIVLITPTQRDYSRDWLSSEYKYLKSSFQEVLEERVSDIDSGDNSGNVHSIWLGNKVQLILTFEYMGVKEFNGKYDKTSRCVVLISKKPNLKEGF